MSRQRGNAAFEVMLLLPVILLILVLVINMGYNGVRLRKTQGALRLGAFSYVDALGDMNGNKARQQAQSLVNQKLFPGESGAVTLSTSNDKNPPAKLPANDGILAQASFRQVVGVSVKRDLPYDMWTATPAEGNLTLSANTFTFCEMKDEDYKGGQMGALNVLAFVGNYGLWLFGGCGGGAFDFSCKDRCK